MDFIIITFTMGECPKKPVNQDNNTPIFIKIIYDVFKKKRRLR